MADRRLATVEALTGGVDWISATLTRDAIDDQTWLWDAIHALEKVQSIGNTYKRRSLLGFDGWESGGCFVGSNEQMHYAQFAGKYANDAYHFLEHPKVHISRIDLQVTVKYSLDLIREGRYQYASAIRHNKALPEGRQQKIHLFAGSDGGDTVYVGSPSGEQRGRVYNKHKQSGEQAYERSWRYEAVFRNRHADRVFRSVFTQADALNTIIVPRVVEFFRERGVSILGLEHQHGIAAESVQSPPTDVERKLRWIRNQVIPTIRKLAELGYAEDLMDAISEAISAARNSQL